MFIGVCSVVHAQDWHGITLTWWYCCAVWKGFWSRTHYDSRNLHLHHTIVPPTPPHDWHKCMNAHTHACRSSTRGPEQATPPCTCPQPHVDTLAVKLLCFTWRHNWHKLLSRWYRSCCLRPSIPLLIFFLASHTEKCCGKKRLILYYPN